MHKGVVQSTNAVEKTIFERPRRPKIPIKFRQWGLFFKALPKKSSCFLFDVAVYHPPHFPKSNSVKTFTTPKAGN